MSYGSSRYRKFAIVGWICFILATTSIVRAILIWHGDKAGQSAALGAVFAIIGFVFGMIYEAHN